MQISPGSGLIWRAGAQQADSEFGADEVVGMFLSLGGVAIVVSGATVFILWLHLALLRRYPVLGPPRQTTATPERPIRVLVACLLMGPVGLVWPVVGLAYLFVLTRLEEDGDLLLYIGLAMVGLSLLVAAVIAMGMWRAWRGSSVRPLLGAALATAVFFLTIAVLLSIVGVVGAVVEEGPNFFVMALPPMLVGLYTSAIVMLLSGRTVRSWFRSRRELNAAAGPVAAPGSSPRPGGFAASPR